MKRLSLLAVNITALLVTLSVATTSTVNADQSTSPDQEYYSFLIETQKILDRGNDVKLLQQVYCNSNEPDYYNCDKYTKQLNNITVELLSRIPTIEKLKLSEGL